MTFIIIYSGKQNRRGGRWRRASEREDTGGGDGNGGEWRAGRSEQQQQSFLPAAHCRSWWWNYEVPVPTTKFPYVATCYKNSLQFIAAYVQLFCFQSSDMLPKKFYYNLF